MGLFRKKGKVGANEIRIEVVFDRFDPRNRLFCISFGRHGCRKPAVVTFGEPALKEFYSAIGEVLDDVSGIE